MADLKSVKDGSETTALLVHLPCTVVLDLRLHVARRQAKAIKAGMRYSEQPTIRGTVEQALREYVDKYGV